MFNLLFDRFIKNQQLKNFYRLRCRDLDLSDTKQITLINNGLYFHLPKYFDKNGNVLEENPISILQKNVNYDVWKSESHEPFSKPINELLLVSKNTLLSGGYYFKKYLKYKYKYLMKKNNISEIEYN